MGGFVFCQYIYFMERKNIRVDYMKKVGIYMAYWYLMLVLLFLAGILLFFILSRITVNLEYYRSPELHKVGIYIYLLKKLKVYSKVIIVDRGRTEEHGEYKKRLMKRVEKVVDILFKSVDTIREYNEMLKSITRKARRGFEYGKFSLRTRIGTGDAALTGITCGLAWSVLGILRMQKEYGEAFKDMDFLVCPDFKKKIFTVDMNCIFTIKTVHIISVIRSTRKIFELERMREHNSGEDDKKNKEFLETG